MKTLEDLVEDGYETVRSDVATALRNHPNYGPFIDSLVSKVLGELFKMAA